jgi:branched-chain amino acid aminotransferase group II
VEYFIESLKALIAVDGAWVPAGADQSLYLRPFMFAKEAFLGVRPANKVGYYVIASPVGAYFKGGAKPVSIWLSEDYARAGKGGTGAAKTGGNYAASLLPQAEAYEQGCDQVVFLDQDRNVEELGGMNVVFVYKDGTIVTPQSDSILEGITRDSILQLAADRGHKVEGRAVSIDEWREGVASGDIVEVFACGTAAVVAPIGVLKGATSSTSSPRPLALSLRDELTDIQYGRREDTHGWLVRLDAPGRRGAGGVRVVRFSHNDAIRFGIVDETELVVLAGDPLFAGFETTGSGFRSVRSRCSHRSSRARRSWRRQELPRPRRRDGRRGPAAPLLFLKPNTAVIGPGDAIVRPTQSERTDFEGELAVVIGRVAKNVPASAALDYVFGYTIGNDVTARDLQKSDGQWARAKGSTRSARSDRRSRPSSTWTPARAS